MKKPNITKVKEKEYKENTDNQGYTIIDPCANCPADRQEHCFTSCDKWNNWHKCMTERPYIIELLSDNGNPVVLDMSRILSYNLPVEHKDRIALAEQIFHAKYVDTVQQHMFDTTRTDSVLSTYIASIDRFKTELTSNYQLCKDMPNEKPRLRKHCHRKRVW